MATIILGAVIFGFAGFVIVSKVRSKSGCDDCHSNCAIKPEKHS